MPSQYTAHALPALPGQGYGPKLMFLLLSTALKEKGKKNGHTEYMANFLSSIIAHSSFQFSNL